MAGKITEKELHSSIVTAINNKAEKGIVNELSSQLEQIASTLTDTKTKADDWTDFKANGGNIGGSITVNSGENLKGFANKRTMGSKEYKSVFGTIGVTSAGTPSACVRLENLTDSTTVGVGVTEEAILPTINSTIDIGSSLYPFKDIYATNAIYSKYIRSNDKYLRLFTMDGQGLTVDTNSTRIVPSANFTFSLGDQNYRFTDVWAGIYSRSSNGYTKLPNGLILQWGTFEDTTLNASTYYKSTYPVKFPVNLLNSFISPYAWDSNTNAIVISARSTGSTTSYIQVRANSTSNSSVAKWGFRWIAIGY